MSEELVNHRHADKLPPHNKWVATTTTASSVHFLTLTPYHRGGLYNQMGVGHTQLCWDIRSEQGLIDVFSQLWGTDELLVSFGG
jgi:hypothetical protein